MAFDIAKFRAAFPAFADVAIYPDMQIEIWADMAACLISEAGCECRDTLIMLMVAHIGQLQTLAAAGENATGVVTASAIDKVSVSFSAPPFVDGWGYWLGLTPYGQQLNAMLSACAIGGFYSPGRPEQAAFRKTYGVF